VNDYHIVIRVLSIMLVRIGPKGLLVLFIQRWSGIVLLVPCILLVLGICIVLYFLYNLVVLLLLLFGELVDDSLFAQFSIRFCPALLVYPV